MKLIFLCWCLLSLYHQSSSPLDILKRPKDSPQICFFSRAVFLHAWHHIHPFAQGVWKNPWCPFLFIVSWNLLISRSSSWICPFHLVPLISSQVRFFCYQFPNTSLLLDRISLLQLKWTYFSFSIAANLSFTSGLSYMLFPLTMILSTRLSIITNNLSILSLSLSITSLVPEAAMDASAVYCYNILDSHYQCFCFVPQGYFSSLVTSLFQ